MENRGYRLVVSDLDGTILPLGQPDFSPFLLATVQRLIDSGVTFVPTTGRSLSFIPKSLLALRGLRYVIFSNGAVVLDRETGEKIHSCLMPAELAAGVIARLLGVKGTMVTAYMDGEMFNPVRPVEELGAYSKRPERFLINRKEDLPGFVAKGGGVEKLSVFHESTEVRDGNMAWLSGMDSLVVVPSTTSNLLEATAAGVDKALAVRTLIRHLRIPAERTIGMGDNFNDLSMLRETGLAAVPASAREDFRAMADAVFPPCAEDGGATFLMETFGL